ncbi:hypothetical protein AAZX31_18G169800 [Glycine max]
MVYPLHLTTNPLLLPSYFAIDHRLLPLKSISGNGAPTAPTPTWVKSQPLHNFVLNVLKWGMNNINNAHHQHHRRPSLPITPLNPIPAPIALNLESPTTKSPSLSNHHHHTEPSTTTSMTPSKTGGTFAIANPHSLPKAALEIDTKPSFPTTTTPATTVTENSKTTTTIPRQSHSGFEEKRGANSGLLSPMKRLKKTSLCFLF